MVMPYHLHMPSYFLETFTEYPYVVKSSLNTNTPTRTAVRGSNAPNKEVNVGPANFTAFTNVILEIAVAGSASPPI